MKNYYHLYLKKIEQLKTEEKKASLLLHTCCALCFSSAFMQLKDYFEITVYFFNPNIYPIEEYEKRKNEVLRLIDIFQTEFNISIHFIEEKENFISYNKVKVHQNHCYDCLNYRIYKSFLYAQKHNFDYITTTLTVGRLKNSYLINSIGEYMQTFFLNTKYLFSDFKKNKGIDLSLHLKEKYLIYAQNYCGCEKYTNQ